MRRHGLGHGLGLGVGTKRSERGAAIVEAAIILPVIVMLTFGALEVGFALSDASGLRSSVRSGARIGAALSRQSTQLPAIVDAVDQGLKSVSFARATDLLVYTGDNVTGITSCSDPAAPAMCVDIPASGKNTFAVPNPTPPQWVITNEDSCVTQAWKLGVTVVARYSGITKVIPVPKHFTATMLIDLEPVVQGSCR
jgi:Flp pilus assembly protein TadG